MVEALSIVLCSASTSSVLLLYILPVVAIFFILLGLIARIGFLGFFGSVLLLVFSWFLSPCTALFSLVVASLGLVLVVWFVVGSIGVDNKVFS